VRGRAVFQAKMILDLVCQELVTGYHRQKMKKKRDFKLMLSKMLRGRSPNTLTRFCPLLAIYYQQLTFAKELI
jgi:hypothetical protein